MIAQNICRVFATQIFTDHLTTSLRPSGDIRTKYIDYQLYILTINSAITRQLTVFLFDN
jgi:hypothetical protein